VAFRSPQMKRAIGILLVPAILIAGASWLVAAADPYEQARKAMVEKDISARGIKDPLVLDAMSKVPRHLFVDESHLKRAYDDHPLPIGEDQTISQPYVVALMTEAAALKGGEKVLEIGTGSGYQAAVLAGIAKSVYTLEIRKGLYDKVRERLKVLGYKNIFVRHGDGYFGWEEEAPFDAILVTASANHIPPPLLKQLKEGGRLIIPLGSTVFHQNLTVVTKVKGEYRLKELGGVVFVPMTGEVQKKK
jgi:protein-L-isoaspartate(D-aspartate) O-methyltransferase